MTSCGLTPAASRPEHRPAGHRLARLGARLFAVAAVFVLGRFEPGERRLRDRRRGRGLGAGRGEGAEQEHGDEERGDPPVGSEARRDGRVPRPASAPSEGRGSTSVAAPLRLHSKRSRKRISMRIIAGPATSAKHHVPRRVGDFERDRAPLEDPESLPGQVSTIGRHQREVEDRAVADRGEAADHGERPPSHVAADERERRAEDPAEPPRRHLPGRPRSLPEPEVGDQRGERADREARRRAERVSGEDDDVGGRLDVGEGGEGDPPGDRQRGERGDEGDDLRGRSRALVPGEAAEQDAGEDQEADQLPAHAAPPGASELCRPYMAA